MTEIFEQSEQAKTKISRGVETSFPFAKLEPGQSFAVKFSDITETSIRSICYAQGKRLKRKFSCIKHTEGEVFEITRRKDE